MTGKNPQKTGENPLIHRESAGITMDHSNYWTDKHNGTQEKSTTDRKKSADTQGVCR